MIVRSWTPGHRVAYSTRDLSYDGLRIPCECGWVVSCPASVFLQNAFTEFWQRHAEEYEQEVKRQRLAWSPYCEITLPEWTL